MPSAKPAKSSAKVTTRSAAATVVRSGTGKRGQLETGRAKLLKPKLLKPSPKPSITKGTTVRLAPAVKAGLAQIQAQLKIPANKIINLAVAQYVDIATQRLEAELEAKLAKLRAYRMSDPGYEKAIAAFADAEAAHGPHDPAEGSVVTHASAGRRRSRRHA